MEGATLASSPLSLLDERCSASVPKARLSRRPLERRGQPKYPLAVSMLRRGGGEVVRGEGIALWPLALLELFRLRPLRRRVRWNVFIRLAAAGEKLLDQTTGPPGLAVLFGAKGVWAFGLLSL